MNAPPTLSDVARRHGGRARTQRLVVSLACVSFLAACSSSSNPSSETAQLVPAGVLSRLDGYCGGPEAVDLGGGSLCIDNGFRLNRDDFSFANWGRSLEADGNVTVQTLVDLFGRDTVCSDEAIDSCLPRPAALQLIEEWNHALSGGRCEGMAAMTVRFQLDLDEPAEWNDEAGSVATLDDDDLALQSALVYWWATQFTPEVSTRAAASRSRAPLLLVEELVRGLANEEGMTLGLYSATAGHAVVPFAVTRREEGFVIHVADNNAPGERREVIVGRDGRWRFPRAATAADGSWREWSGGTGSIELTPLSARRGPFTCIACASAEGRGTDDATIVTLSSRDPDSPGRLIIDSAAGRLDTGQSEDLTIPGAIVRTAKGGDSFVEVVIPGSITELRVSVIPGDRGPGAGDVVLSMRRGGLPSVLLSGDLSRGGTSPSMVMNAGSVNVSAPPDTAVRVSIAAGSRLTSSDLQAGESMTIRGGGNRVLEVSTKGVDGRDSGSIAIDPPTDSRTVLTRLERGPGGLTFTSRPGDRVLVTDGDGDGPSGPGPPTIELTAPEG